MYNTYKNAWHIVTLVTIALILFNNRLQGPIFPKAYSFWNSCSQFISMFQAITFPLLFEDFPHSPISLWSAPPLHFYILPERMSTKNFKLPRTHRRRRATVSTSGRGASFSDTYLVTDLLWYLSCDRSCFFCLVPYFLSKPVLLEGERRQIIDKHLG